MKRAIVTISESGRVNIPSGNVWMSEMELVELFGVVAPTVRAAIKAIYKSGTLNPATTQQGEAITFYNLEVVISLAFRLNTYEASRIRAKVLEGLYMRNKSEINMFITLKSERNDKYYQAEQNNLQ